MKLEGKRIIFGISGGIAAYKTPLILRLLVKEGASVQVVMTEGATRFVTQETLATLSRNPVLISPFSFFSEDTSEPMGWTKHIKLAQESDLFFVAPATANTIARLAHGFSDDMLTLTAAALPQSCPKLLFPSMDGEMSVAPALQRNLALLSGDGFTIIPPEEGELASGAVGKGRLPEPETIVMHLKSRLSDALPGLPYLKGKRVLITAGGTKEKLDPVRFLSNFSSGKMGYALAAAAKDAGAEVIVLSATKHLPAPSGVQVIYTQSAQDMHREAVARFDSTDVFIGAAAVADYRPMFFSTEKIKKSGEQMHLTLVKNPDILADFGSQKKPGQCAIGFALETTYAEEEAALKLDRKKADFIVLNEAGNPHAGFESETNQVKVFWRSPASDALLSKAFPLMPKKELAHQLLRLCLGQELNSLL